MIDLQTNGAKYPLDIENTHEKLTPYMLAVLRENFDIASVLIESGKCDMVYKNVKGETVFNIAHNLDIKPVMKYLMKEMEKMKDLK